LEIRRKDKIKEKRIKKGEVNMEKNNEKYARLVFEVENHEGTTGEEIVRKMKECVENYMKDGVSIDDIEISEYPYMRDGDV
jgi:hypothetical protein